MYDVAVHTMDRCFIASVAIRITSDTSTRDEEQEQRWRERQDRGGFQDLTVQYYMIPVINLKV